MYIYNDDDQNTFKDIEMYKEIIKKKEIDIKYLELDKECITLSLINKIRNIPSMTVDWAKVTKYVNDKNKDCKKSYDEFRNILFLHFGLPTNIKISSIISCGYENYGYRVMFTKNKKEYFIFIPVHKVANTSNYKYMYYGKYVFGCYDGKCCYSNHLYTYNPSDINKALKEFKIIKED